MKQIIIIGGGYAGMMAANRLAGKSDARITLINASDAFVERIRLHQQASGQSLKSHQLRDLLSDKIQFVRGMVTAIHPEAHTLEVNGGAETQTLKYDFLVYALGSHTDRDSVPGVREHAYTFDLSQITALQTVLTNAKQIVICGGGLTGIEGATEFAEAYPDAQVALVTQGRIGSGLSDGGYAHIRRVFERLNIQVVEQTSIQRIEANQIVIEGADYPIPFDVCLWAGAFAVPQLAKQAGIKTNAKGQIMVDAYLRSLSHPDIFVAGDSAYLTPREPLRMACATAMPMGTKVADNLIATLNERPLSEMQFAFVLQCISLGRHEGLVQLVKSDDSPRKSFFAGRLAAIIKELICRYTILSIHFERLIPGSYWYPKGKSVKIERKVEVSHGSI